MLRGHLLSVWFVLALVLTTGTPLAASAQDATPAASLRGRRAPGRRQWADQPPRHDLGRGRHTLCRPGR